MPLMLFLHGRGESNGPLSVVAEWASDDGGEGRRTAVYSRLTAVSSRRFMAE